MADPGVRLVLWSAAALAAAVGVAHSWLGARYLLAPVLAAPEWRMVLGRGFANGTLVFAWHLTTVAWFAAALTFVALASLRAPAAAVLAAWSAAFLVHAALAFGYTGGRHLAWPVFLAIAALCTYAAWRVHATHVAVSVPFR